MYCSKESAWVEWLTAKSKEGILSASEYLNEPDVLF